MTLQDVLIVRATSGLLGFTPQLLAAVDSVDPRVDLGIYVTDAPRSVILVSRQSSTQM